ncbi:type VI secretion system tip protein TssI/VgrG [Collimonas sp. H4R21]|uniref:Type VI secretion system tip protein TssI/VgrG n=1 Tax=Collimonas rhizosphaerae TaxID=3126357 RepID=A0ABU9PY56_9BURK
MTQEFISSWHKGLGQHSRLLKLETLLGQDVLLPQRLVAEDRLGRGYEYTVDALSLDRNIPLKQLIAQPVTLWLQQADQRSYLPVHGYVQRARKLGCDGLLTTYQLTFRCWLHFLKYRKDSRIWQDRDATDILSEVFNRHPQGHGRYRFKLSRPPAARSYCTQYETDWHFAMRLMEEEGWYCYHEQQEDGKDHLLVITDSARSLPALDPAAVRFHRAGCRDEADKITEWSGERQLRSRKLETVTTDYKVPRQAKGTARRITPEHGNIPEQLEVYEYTGAYTYGQRAQGDLQAQNTVEGWESQAKRYFAWSAVRRMAVGSYFSFEGHADHAEGTDEQRQFIVIGLHWYVENNLPLSGTADDVPGSLREQLAAIKERASAGQAAANSGFCINRIEVQRRSLEYRSPREHHKPVMHTQTAVVTGPEGEEIFTDALNRVKVKFVWANGVASCWVRVSYPNAGNNYGGVYTPRINMEVIVTFLDGDADRPVITGRLYNGDQAPHWHTDGKLSGYKSKEHMGKGYNQLVMDDNTRQNRLQLYSTNTHAQLNLGYLVSQQGNTRQAFYGSGFALNTNAYGAVVAGQGLYLSTFGRPGATGSQLDVREAHQQLTTARRLTKTLSDAAAKVGAPALAAQDALEQFIDATQEQYAGQGQEQANRFRQPILLAASPAGIGLATPSSTHLHSGDHLTVSSGQDTNLAAGNNLAASVKQQISLFASQGDISHIAGRGKVAIEAHDNAISLVARKVIEMISAEDWLRFKAKKGISFNVGGTEYTIQPDGHRWFTPGVVEHHAISHGTFPPQSRSAAMPVLPKDVCLPCMFKAGRQATLIARLT